MSNPTAIPPNVNHRSEQELVYACLLAALGYDVPEIGPVPLSIAHRSTQELLYALRQAIIDGGGGGGGGLPVASVAEARALTVNNKVISPLRLGQVFTPFSAGDNLSGEIGLNLSDGPVQRLSLSGDSYFGINGGSHGNRLTLIIDWTSGNLLDLSFFRMPAEALALNPVTLEVWKTYKLEFQHLGGAWQLLDLSPALVESID